jgi:hypothetical protein
MCGVEKPTVDFYRHKNEKGRKPRIYSECKKCCGEAVRKSTEKNPLLKEKARKWRREDYSKNKPMHWARSTIKNHSLKGFVIGLNHKDLGKKAIETKNCFICGCELKWNRKDGDPQMCNNTPTLDRMDNGNDLTMENTEIVCLSCNATKRHRTFKEFTEYCKFISEKFG